MKLHCDNCEKECPPFDEATRQGWYLSLKKSVSGIPWDMLCPICKYTDNKPLNLPKEKFK